MCLFIICFSCHLYVYENEIVHLSVTAILHSFRNKVFRKELTQKTQKHLLTFRRNSITELMLNSTKGEDINGMTYYVMLLNDCIHFKLGSIYYVSFLGVFWTTYPSTYVRTFSVHKVKGNYHFLNHHPHLPTHKFIRNIWMVP